MSAYSDWKCGALTDDEYAFACSWVAAMDKAAEEAMYNECNDNEEDY